MLFACPWTITNDIEAKTSQKYEKIVIVIIWLYKDLNNLTWRDYDMSYIWVLSIRHHLIKWFLIFYYMYVVDSKISTAKKYSLIILNAKDDQIAYPALSEAEFYIEDRDFWKNGLLKFEN